MTRLLVHVEGETEETFVREILARHLSALGFHPVSARLIGNSRMRDHRGGIRSWSTVRSGILNHLKQDSGCLVTTMVDYYGLPGSGDHAWPGRHGAGGVPFHERARTVQDALRADILREMGDGFDPRRFIPYVMMHEFEGLLFSDCSRFSHAIGRPELAAQFQAIRDSFGSPEEINDSPVTAPSKRIKSLLPSYQKPLLGTLAILEIGLGPIRRECPNFRRWLEQLEAWPS